MSSIQTVSVDWPNCALVYIMQPYMYVLLPYMNGQNIAKYSRTHLLRLAKMGAGLP